MATQIYNDTVTIASANKQTTNTNIYNLFSRYSNKFTYDSTNNEIIFNNMLVLSFSDGGSWATGNVKIMSLDRSTTYVSYQQYRDTYTIRVKIIITDHSFMFYNMDTTYSSDFGPFWLVLYLKDASSCYAGLSYRGNNAIDSITNFVNINTLAPVTSYSIQKISTKALNSPYILFTTACMLINSGGDFALLEDFRSCSPILALSTVSINNKNYFAVGTNTLIEAPAS